nr:MBOAT family O-acyltransferase [uncultured Campylobacter sp.]
MNLFSIEFGLCFFIFWPIYYFLNTRPHLQKVVLLAFSYLFLGSFGLKFLIINFIFSTAIFLFARAAQSKDSAIPFAAGVVFILCALAFFKYGDYFAIKFTRLHLENIALPLGISFYSFMSTLLLKAVRDGEIEAPDYLDTLIFLSFFAAIISGPILRPKPFFEALNSPKVFRASPVIFALLCSALFKKLIVANHLFEIVNPVFAAPTLPASQLLGALFGYSVLLYADFSGYVDFVTALGLMCGFVLPQNFNRPFTARNLKIFWQNWHISLMNFFKECVYFPLGGSRGTQAQTQLNVMLVFVISGVWHGAGLSFLLWGLIHGLGVVFLNLTDERKWLNSAILGRYFTFIFVSMAWVFFTMDFEGAVRYIGAIFRNSGGELLAICALFAGVFVFVFLYSALDVYPILVKFFENINAIFSAVFLAIFGIIIYFLMPSGMPNFIYQGF